MKTWLLQLIRAAVFAAVLGVVIGMYFEQRDTRDITTYWQGRADGEMKCMKQRTGASVPKGDIELTEHWLTNVSL